MKFDILSLFPDFIEAFFDHSIIKRAIESGRVEMAVTDPRTFSKDKHHHVDDTIYGGGAGMLMQCGPLFDAVESVLPEKGPRDRVIFLSPAGQTFTQDKAKQLYRDYDHLVLICGHYEGVDHRVEEYLADELISIGDYVLTGGELGAMVIADAVSRRLQIQERIGADIRTIIEKVTGSQDVIVRIDGEHSCMTARGIKKPGAVTTTISSSGKFNTPEYRQLFKEML